MDEKQLERLISQHLSTHKIADKLNTSQSNVRYWLKKYNLKTKHKNTHRGSIRERKCLECGKTNKKDFYKSFKIICKSCFSKKRVEEFINKKLKAINYLGGSCVVCGYKRYYGALEFHHTDPSKKDVSWRDLRKRSWDRIIIELDKCELLCSNCHKEVHGKIISL